MKTGFIGVGNMGGAILRSFAASDNIDTGSLYIYSRTVSKTEALARELGVKTCGSAAELAKACDIIIIGVKPDTVASVMEQIAPVYTPDKIIISMAAGISIRAIEDMAGVSAKVIRIMPNTPVMVGEGMTAIFVNDNITEEDKQTVYDMFSRNWQSGICGREYDTLHYRGVGFKPRIHIYVYRRTCAGGADRGNEQRAGSGVCGSIGSRRC